MDQEQTQQSISNIAEERKKPRKQWLTEGLIITSIPILAYGLTFTFEAGFGGVFDIPLSFISLSLTTVFVVTAVLSVFLPIFSFAIFPILLLPIGLGEVASIGRTMFRWVPFFLIYLGIAITLRFPLLGWFALFSYLLVLIIFCETARVQIKIVELILLHDSFSSLRTFLLIGSILWTTLIGCYFAGRDMAIRQVQFLIVRASSEMAVLRVYGDKLICAPFDRTTKEVKRTFTILKMAENPSLTLSPEKVGPLHIEKWPTEVLQKSISAPTDSLEGLNKK